MKRLRALVTAWLVVLITAGWVYAQDTPHAPETADQSKDAVKQAEDYVGETAQTLESYSEPAGEEHAGTHGKRDLTTFVWQEAAYTIVVFVLFFLILSIFVWPKILASLQAREDKVRGDLNSAEQSAKEAAATLTEYKQQLADAQKQAQQIVEESRTAAQQVAHQLKEQAQAEINQTKERAQADIAAAKERAVSEIYDQAGTLATQVAGQILRREINAGDQAALISESIEKLRSAEQN